MVTYYPKPENALKRAEDLVAVNQHSTALEMLHEMILSKRSRGVPIPILEPVVLKFVELSVHLDRGKVVREGLFQYKHITQNVGVNTIEVVIKRFLELSKDKLAVALRKAKEINLNLVEDLEAAETPESVMTSTLSEESKTRSDKQMLTPGLRFLWEAYRTALDTLRNNSRLENLYRDVAKDACQFCVQFQRKVEFRRLCDILRQQLASAAKYAHLQHAIDLSDDDTLQKHIDIRFAQLNAAADMELWQECFQSVEDVHNLLQLSTKAPKLFMMAKYYEILFRVLMVGENYLFHAAAYHQYFSTIRHKPNVNMNDYASTFLVAVLAVPIIKRADDATKAERFTTLLRVGQVPTREGLLKVALAKDILNSVRPEVKELYELLEVQFHPLSICQKVAPIMKTFAEDPVLCKYVKPLNQIILTRLIQQLSQVYSSIKIESVVKLAAFQATKNYDAHDIEKFVMSGCNRGEFSIKIDQRNHSLIFEKNVFESTSASRVSLPVDDMRAKLDAFAARLQQSVYKINPALLQEKEKAKLAAFALAAEKADVDRETTIYRRQLIEQKAEEREEELQKEEAKRHARLLELQAIEERRLAEQEKLMAAERLKQQRKEIERTEALKLAEKIAAELREKNVKIKDDEMLDTEKLKELQVQQLEKERRSLAQKNKTLTKLLDHTVRAFRLEEIPLLEDDYQKQLEEDKNAYELKCATTLKTAKAKHAQNVILKKRLEKVLADYETYRATLQQERDAEYEVLLQEAQAKIEEEKALRIQEYEEAAAARAAAEAAAAEAARIEAEKKEAARKARELADAEREKQRAKLDEIARIQRQKELEIEAKLNAEAEQKEKEAPKTTAWKAGGKWSSSRNGEVAPSSTPSFGSRTTPGAFQTEAKRGPALQPVGKRGPALPPDSKRGPPTRNSRWKE